VGKIDFHFLQANGFAKTLEMKRLLGESFGENENLFF
jgi:hypothetical protein